MTPHRFNDVANLVFRERHRLAPRGLRAALAVLIVLAATPAFAHRGDPQDVLANSGDYVVTNGNG